MHSIVEAAEHNGKAYGCSFIGIIQKDGLPRNYTSRMKNRGASSARFPACSTISRANGKSEVIRKPIFRLSGGDTRLHFSGSKHGVFVRSKGIIPTSHAMKYPAAEASFKSVQSVQGMGRRRIGRNTEHIIFRAAVVFSSANSLPLKGVGSHIIPAC